VRRAQILAAFERSGLSAAAFARQQQLNYTTFCGWRQRQRGGNRPRFVEVEVSARSEPTGLVIELGRQPRMRIDSAEQIALAAELLQQLNAPRPC